MAARRRLIWRLLHRVHDRLHAVEEPRPWNAPILSEPLTSGVWSHGQWFDYDTEGTIHFDYDYDS